MKKPIIAIDVDDVLVQTAGEIIRDYNTHWGTRLTLHDFYATHRTKAWGTNEETAIMRVDQYLQTPAYFALKPAQEAIGSLQKLSETYDLHVLTGRSDLIAEATRAWLQENFPNMFGSVNFSNLYNKDKMRTKGEMCEEIGADVLIDDHLGHAKSAARHGIRAVLFGDYPWNSADLLPTGVTRCKDWPAVLEYFDERTS